MKGHYCRNTGVVGVQQCLGVVYHELTTQDGFILLGQLK